MVDNRRYDQGNGTDTNPMSQDLKRLDFGVMPNSPESLCVEKGYYLIVDNPIEYDQETQTRNRVHVIDYVNGVSNIVYTVTDIPLETLLERAKAKKLPTLEKDFLESESQVVLYNGVNYKGGDNSVTSIDKYVRLNRLAGNTSHTIWDAQKIDHVLTDAEVDGLILTIGASSSANQFVLKNRELALSNATTIAEVDLV